MTDPHDSRPFRQWVKFNADGSIASVHEHAAEVEQPHPEAVETTHLFPFDTTALTIEPALIKALQEAHAVKAFREEALADAVQTAKQAHTDLKVAVTNAGLQQKATAPAPPVVDVNTML